MPRRHSDSQEFSRFIEADSVGAKPLERQISANAEERAALARRFGLQAIDRLDADFTLRRAGNGVIHVKGTVRGQVVQSCVVTLEPVPAGIEEDFAADFVAEAAQPVEDEEIDFTAADPPEPVRNGHIDLGELAAEHLSLALDPYPRAPGAQLQQVSEAPEQGEQPINPFSILKK
jgi:uncharacterized metal-binding protein YceD (DUF177 family)